MKTRTTLAVMAGLTLLAVIALNGCVATQPVESLDNGLPAYGKITPQQASSVILALHDDPSFVLLDIRTPDEVTASHISGATELDFYSPTFSDSLASLDRDLVYLVYCRTGHRSGEAYDMMQELGFQYVYDLDGGITEWTAEGYQVCDGPLDAEHTCTGSWTPSSAGTGT